MPMPLFPRVLPRALPLRNLQASSFHSNYDTSIFLHLIPAPLVPSKASSGPSSARGGGGGGGSGDKEEAKEASSSSLTSPRAYPPLDLERLHSQLHHLAAHEPPGGFEMEDAALYQPPSSSSLQQQNFPSLSLVHELEYKEAEARTFRQLYEAEKARNAQLERRIRDISSSSSSASAAATAPAGSFNVGGGGAVLLDFGSEGQNHGCGCGWLKSMWMLDGCGSDGVR